MLDARGTLAAFGITSALLAGLPRAGGAAGVVGDGTPESCTASALSDALAGGGTVTFACGDAPATIAADTASVGDGVVATVDGGGRIALDGESLRQLFAVLAGGELTLRDIELRNGSAADGGGAVRNAGTAHLERVFLVDNTSGGADGGAIHNAGTLDVSDSTLFANQTTALGGALHNAGGHATLRRCVLEANTAGAGGGIHGAGGTVDVLDTTITNNYANDGGGVYVGGAALLVTGVTLDRNNAEFGGAIFAQSGSATARNSVFARSADRQGLFPSLECDGNAPVQSLGGNLAEDGSCQLAHPTDRNSTPPQLGERGSNGGPTRTVPPLYGSPLIDGGVAAGCSEVDQRGFARPFDGDRDGTATCDIGAFEVPEPACALAAAAAVAALGAVRAGTGGPGTARDRDRRPPV